MSEVTEEEANLPLTKFTIRMVAQYGTLELVANRTLQSDAVTPERIIDAATEMMYTLQRTADRIKP